MRHIGIMRHGDAPYINGERQISNLGHQQIKQMAKWYAEHLKGQGLTLETLLVSPILRAQQTAETFESTFNTLVDYEWSRETEPLLKSESDPSMTIPFVEEATQGTTLLISHMPLVSHLWAGWLTGETQYFPTSAIGILDVAEPADTKTAKKVVFHSPE
ncbi:SixA phosphatase family protein [Kangiella spongicola]|uniref:Phosphohistidine phosphatase SixA n=1 Tax=Kangiella spongicola TaxID=796379 RepID=A0A318CZT3_9GAMM|nr:histidine phosphatase family protein [Kangiella spongicola]PXF62482.1 phosphohistidine phosphatase SixA [Kangiella spongicola]